MKLNDNTTLMVAGILLCGLGAYLFFDIATETLLGLFGLGSGAVIALKNKAKTSKIIADEHEDMADIALVASTKELNEAIADHDETLAIAKKQQQDGEINDNDLPPGFKRTNISSS